jgi:hypothetical protein
VANPYEHALSASWLSTKWGIDTVTIEAMRRAGELVAVRPGGTHEWRFPAWQFGDDGGVRPDVERLLAVARERGISPERLGVLLHRRSGLTSSERLLDDLLAGRTDHVIRALDRG